MAKWLTIDPGNRMNPGKVVHPYRLDENLTRRGWFPREPRTFFHYPQDDYKFSGAASRCVGVGKCRGDEGGVMCPSYRATREEEHSTRGRSRLLMEMVRGEVITDGWHSTEVLDALDLCLACKGCRKECPVDVDMATYKAEFLAHHYSGRLRPPAHYSMGWLPLVTLLAAAAPGAVNAAGQAPGLGRLIKRARGIDAQRELPQFAHQRFTRWHARRLARPSGPPVILWPDTFTNNFHPGVGRAAARVLEDAGSTVQVPTKPLCCGLIWISTGQLGTASRILKRTIAALRPALMAGQRIVVLEPSCAAVFRSDAAELLGSDDARLLARQTTTLAELLSETRWRPRPGHEQGAPRKAIAQVHCHQHAIMGFGKDTELLKACGVDVDVLDTGCCGLAGNFGFERGHYDVSSRVRNTGCSPRSGTRPRTPRSSRTGSPAGLRSRPGTLAARASTSPNCSPACCPGHRTIHNARRASTLASDPARDLRGDGPGPPTGAIGFLALNVRAARLRVGARPWEPGTKRPEPSAKPRNSPSRPGTGRASTSGGTSRCPPAVTTSAARMRCCATRSTRAITPRRCRRGAPGAAATANRTIVSPGEKGKAAVTSHV